MRIIKPYGRSFTEHNGNGLVRKLQDNQADVHSITEFVTQHDELLIAQWISTIDKIASKPFKSKATQAQFALRTKIGKACWQILLEKSLFSEFDNERRKYLEQLWDFKVHPYDKNDIKKASAKNRNKSSSHVNREQSPKGRWYLRFVGDIEPDQVNGELVASAIFQYLHNNGLIQSRAKSIEGNVLRKSQSAVKNWDISTLNRYSQEVDIAEVIYKAARQLEENNKKVTGRLAAQCLYEHWPKVFANSDGSAMSIGQAKRDLPELFDLHSTIKDSYARLLEKHRPNPKTKHADLRKISMVLPQNTEALAKLIDNQQQNRELAGLVRLGKILHYTASDKAEQINNSEFAGDSPEHIGVNWPTEDEINHSHYWASDGQAEIKRSEAFVRVWRGVISHAQRNFTDWAMMRAVFYKSDILGVPIDDQINDEAINFDKVAFDNKAVMLFGSQVSLFTQNDNVRKAVFKSIHSGLGGLRNASFHFKGRGKFIDSLTSLESNDNFDVIRVQVEQLWRHDQTSRKQVLIEQLRGAHCEHYLSLEQAEQLLRLVNASSVVRSLPLPRFNRILKRAGNAWKNQPSLNRLPSTGNASTFEKHPEQLCQYVCLKLLYEKSFRIWLESCDSAQLGRWFDIAVKRADDAAKKLTSDSRKDFINSRMSTLRSPASGAGIKRFFFDLSAATASEMRVQRGYESDAENAKEQAGYIDDLLCDVVVLALNHYLNQSDLGWVFYLTAKQTNDDETKFQFSEVVSPQVGVSTHVAWQAPLYFLLHLVPVEEVGRLSHQLAKWEVLAGREETIDGVEAQQLQNLMAALDLYLSQHDAKFSGGLELTGCDAFKDFFADSGDFDKVFPTVEHTSDQRLVPKRKLREVSRYGHDVLLKTLNGERKISTQTVTDSLDASRIVLAQQQRQELHKKWSTTRRGQFSAEDYRSYCEALREIIQFRQLNAEATLGNHLQVHRIVMSVLGRLVDYAGLFERDLYFVTLALLQSKGLKPDSFFTANGLDKFSNGQLLDSLNKTESGPEANALLDKLKTLFGDFTSNDQGSIRNIRNNLAHFNMLGIDRDTGQLKNPLDLTDMVNKTRCLMAYDRKLKNAVSQSIKELMAREGISLNWNMGSDHQLYEAKLSSRVANHLGNTKLLIGNRRLPISESLCSDGLLEMLSKVFGGTTKPASDIAKVSFEEVSWNQVGKNPPKKPQGKWQKRPQKQRKNR